MRLDYSLSRTADVGLRQDRSIACGGAAWLRRVLCLPGQLLRFPGQVFSVLCQVFSVPGQIPSAAGQVFSVPGQAFSILDRLFRLPGQAFSVLSQVSSVVLQLLCALAQVSSVLGRVRCAPGQTFGVLGQVCWRPVSRGLSLSSGPATFSTGILTSLAACGRCACKPSPLVSRGPTIRSGGLRRVAAVFPVRLRAAAA